MPPLTRLMALIPALGLIGGCATAPTKDTFLKYASPPIDSFKYLGRYNGVRMLGGDDLVLWSTINDAYLITVMEPCPNLPFANKVDFTTATNTVTAKVDWVILLPGSSGDFSTDPQQPKVITDGERCRIDTIRHVDYLAMKQAGIAGP